MRERKPRFIFLYTEKKGLNLNIEIYWHESNKFGLRIREIALYVFREAKHINQLQYQEIESSKSRARGVKKNVQI